MATATVDKKVVEKTADKNKVASGEDRLADIAARQEKLANTLDSLLKDNADRRTPFARKGESALTSRGYSFVKLFRVIAGHVGPEEAKVETDLHNKFRAHSEKFGYARAEKNSIIAPFGSAFLPCDNDSDRNFVDEVRQVVRAGMAGYDPAEVAYIRKTLSWTDESAMGSLVAPPVQGELVEVLRNNEVFMQAGAKTMGLPPSGRLVYPRQTGAGTAYFVGENQTITGSEPSTGDLVLQAKKLACRVEIPNELYRYASVSAEAFVRDDMMKVMALRLDKALLDEPGSSNSPKGLINYAGIYSHTGVAAAADAHSGYPIQPEDIAKMISGIEEQNAVFKTFVMRPALWAALTNRRADAITAADGKGPFVFNITRNLADDMGIGRLVTNQLNGYPVLKSTQISNTLTRGNGTTQNTYVLFGDFADYLVAFGPTIEFAMQSVSDNAFSKDQTHLRAIMMVDGAPLREASFGLFTQVLTV